MSTLDQIFNSAESSVDLVDRLKTDEGFAAEVFQSAYPRPDLFKSNVQRVLSEYVPGQAMMLGEKHPIVEFLKETARNLFNSTGFKNNEKINSFASQDVSAEIALNSAFLILTHFSEKLNLSDRFVLPQQDPPVQFDYKFLTT